MNEREIFEKAIEFQDPAQRQAFLDQACGGDATLRARLDELLASPQQAGQFPNVPRADQGSPPAQDRVQQTIELSPSSGATVGGEQFPPHSDDEDDESHPVADLSFLQPPTKPGSIGTLGHYVILQVLGQGAFGIVFKAFDEKLHRYVAIKAMNPQLAATSPPRKRFVREARSVAAIKHENIVQIYSVEEQPLPYLVMEYIDGQTLQQKLDGAGPLDVPEILHLGRQMAAGLASAHEKGLIHRDIKPGNILLEAGAEQRVKITDFGLARAADDATMTRTGTIAGTPMYMAPEQAMGQTLDHRADLFSLGSVLYQMTCGRAPFRGAHAMAVLKRVVDETPRPIQDILPGAPDWLCAIVGKLHAKNPDERFQTSRELADLLAKCQNELQVIGKVTCVVAPPQVAQASSNPPAAFAVTPAVDRRSATSAASGSRQPLIVAAAAVLLLVAGLTVTELTGITSFIREPASDRQPVASGDTRPETHVATVQDTSPPGWHGWPADAPPPAIAPFDAEQAQQHQEAWAAYLNVPVEYTNSLGMKFRLIPPGAFIMGCRADEIEAALQEISADDKHWQECIKSEGPQHEVILTQPIYLGVNEVTQGEYENVMGTNPSHFAPTGMGNAAVAGMETTDHPVETVSWSDAAEFSAKLSTQEKLKPFYFQTGETITPLAGTGYRLPSEAEWEFACRAGTASKYWIGDQKEDLQQAGWNAVNSGDRTHAVGELKTNPFGLCDIHGNVWEWVQDGWEPNKYDGITELPAVNPGFPFTAGSHHVMRGGNWYNSASLCRSSVRNRNAGDLTYCEDNLGFRVSLSVDAVRQALKVTGPALPKSVATPPSAPASDAIDFAAERRAAEWVLKVGGTLGLADEQGQPIALVEGKLPTMNFVVTQIRAQGKSDVTDEGLSNLAGCRRLRDVNLANCKVTAIGLKAVARSRTLRKLEMTYTLVGEGLGELLSSWPLLEQLGLFGTQVNDEVLVRIPICPRLKVLTIGGSVPITDSGLKCIAERCTNLERLNCQGSSGLLGTTLVPFAPLRELRHLSFIGEQVTEEGINVLKTLPFLESIVLGNPGANQSLALLLRVENKFRSLSIGRYETTPQLTEADFRLIRQYRGLRELEFHGALAVTDTAIRDLAQMEDLTQLRFLLLKVAGAAPYSGAGVAKFRELRPDVHLIVEQKDYPASSTIPFSIIQQLDETDPLPKWELPAGAPPPVVAPCEPTLATERQQQWAEFFQRPVVEELSENTGLGMKFALIPPGEFRKIFTRPRDWAIEPDMPVRRFRITKPYALSTTEVTWDQFRQFVEATGYQTEAETNGIGGRDRAFKPDPKINWRTPGWKPAPNEPVTQVTPKDAEAFCAWLTKSSPHALREESRTTNDDPISKDPNKSKSPDIRPSSRGARGLLYRLPTEAEWVHACRAGSVHKYVVGIDEHDLADYFWSSEFLDPNPQASPLHLVATKRANPFGLHDTIGNVCERVLDVMLQTLAPYVPTNDPVGSLSDGVIGISFLTSNHEKNLSVCEVWAPHTNGAAHVGFRVLQQFDAEPLPGLLDRPLVLRAGQPMSVHALVPLPEKIPCLQSWSLELAGPHGTNPYSGFAASVKGDLMATGSMFGKISLWDRDGNYQRALLGHENPVTSLDFSPDGQWLASGDVPGAERGMLGCTVRVWNLATGAMHALVPVPASLTHIVRFSPDGKKLAVSLDALYQKSFLIVDLATGRTRLPTTIEQRGYGLAWSPDGTKLAVSTLDSRLRIWDVGTLRVLQEVESVVSHSLAWSPDGRLLATFPNDGNVAIRDAKTLEVTKSFASNQAYQSSSAFAWLPDSKRLVVGGSGVFDVVSGEQLTKFDNGGPGWGMATIDEGKQAVFELGGRLHFYDTFTGQKLRAGKERGQILFNYIEHVLVPRTGEIFSQNPSRNELRVMDATTGTERRRVSTTLLGIAQPSPDAALFSGQTTGNRALVVDSKTGTTRHDLPHGDGIVWRVAWSTDGKWLATGATDKLVRVWNVATGKIEHELTGHTGTIFSLAWSPDGTRLASAAEDKTVRLWNPLAGKLVATYDQFPEVITPHNGYGNSLAWTADSRSLWIALTNNIVPLDVESGTFGPLENFSNGNVMTYLNTSTDGQRLLAREGYGWTFVRGRDAQDRRLLGQHLGQTTQWHPDSRRFVGWEPHYGTVGFDVQSNRRLGMLFPWLTGDHWLCLGPTGHYRGSPGVEDQIVYVAMLEDGSQRSYTPAEFAEKFGWKNAPEKATLLQLTP